MTLLPDLAVRWGGDKTELSNWLGVGDDGLHVLVGVLALLVLALVSGRRLDDWRLWTVVLLAECANEVVDLSAPDFPEANWSGAAHDVILTMALPTVLLLLLRFTDRRRPQAAASTEAASDANRAAPSVDG